MTKHELQTAIEELHKKFQPLTEGHVATYIPELRNADPERFAISLAMASGRLFEVGDCEQPFTLQSISKPFTFGMALETVGRTKVAKHVGVEPSGDAFIGARSGLSVRPWLTENLGPSTLAGFCWER